MSVAPDPKAPENWDLVIEPRARVVHLPFRELWAYRDLIALFVQRDFVTFYKQTVLGPLWYVIQPLFTALIFTLVFGAVARIPTDGVSPFLFYLAGNVVWQYFSANVTKGSETFAGNAQIFGKVYFPRLTVPVSVVISNVIQFGIQLTLFGVFYAVFLARGGNFAPTLWILALPLLVLEMALFGLGVGILISSLTTKYRDLRFALTFVVQLWMYASPVVYPSSQIPERWLYVFMLNPMASILECFRFMFFGVGLVTLETVALGWVVTLLSLVGALVLFQRVERNFMDTV